MTLEKCLKRIRDRDQLGCEVNVVRAGIKDAFVSEAPTKRAKSHLAFLEAHLKAKSREARSTTEGFVLGIATSIVTPPANAAAVPDAQSSVENSTNEHLAPI